MSSFSIEERPDGIHVIYLADFRRDTTDEWVAASRELLALYNVNGQHLRILAKMAKTAMPTPYGMPKAIQLASERPRSLALSMAVIIPNNFILTGLRFILNQVRDSHYVEMCDTEEKAIQWLDERHRQYLSGQSLS
ncbi:MAG: hypothetical protein KC546_16440 [Anaerolineae bacterium]|nr:hypothetical protein [Anaerolineae bacterium]MCA9889971.1 hypothetical protein [Anaerolineae bacterium]MCB9460729.1 hypothetical protein [Anaerolineaceae bacterium]